MWQLIQCWVDLGSLKTITFTFVKTNEYNNGRYAQWQHHQQNYELPTIIIPPAQWNMGVKWSPSDLCWLTSVVFVGLPLSVRFRSFPGVTHYVGLMTTLHCAVQVLIDLGKSSNNYCKEFQSIKAHKEKQKISFKTNQNLLQWQI